MYDVNSYVRVVDPDGAPAFNVKVTLRLCEGVGLYSPRS